MVNVPPVRSPDTRLALATQVPDFGQTFSNTLMNIQRLDALKENRAQQGMRNRLLEAQIQAQEQGLESPVEQNLRQLKGRSREGGFIASRIIPYLKSDDFEGAKAELESIRGDIQSRGGDTRNIDAVIQSAVDPDELLARSIQMRDADRQINPDAYKARSGAQKGGTFAVTTEKGPGIATSVFLPEEGKTKVDIQTLGPGVRFVSGMGETPEQQTSRKISEAAGTAAARADVELETKPKITEEVVKAEEETRLKAQKRFKPQIEAAVTKARQEAESRGETLSDLGQMQAALPGLQQAVAQLKELAPIATSTLLGRAFDAAVRETGFGATKGATARAKFIAIVDNQVLPLLKQTFGGSFSVQEGESLKATMGDPNLSTDEKMGQLDAFISQKIRDIETKQRQLGVSPKVEDMSDEEFQARKRVILGN